MNQREYLPELEKLALFQKMILTVKLKIRYYKSEIDFYSRMKNIMKKDLLQNGFKLNKTIFLILNGITFIKKTNNIKEIINIYGSTANEVFFDTKEFFIDISIYNKNARINYVRLPNLPSINRPQKYNEYYSRDINKLDDGLTIEQRQEIWNYTQNLLWHYNVNIESVILEKVKYVIINYGIKYLEEIKKIILENNNIQKEIINETYNKIFYWAMTKK